MPFIEGEQFLHIGGKLFRNNELPMLQEGVLMKDGVDSGDKKSRLNRARFRMTLAVLTQKFRARVVIIGFQPSPLHKIAEVSGQTHGRFAAARGISVVL